MTMKKFAFMLMAFPLLGIGMASCSDEEEFSGGGNESDEAELVVDELKTLQSSLVKVDDNGAFQERIVGVPLDQADTTEVSVGVDNLKEAKAMFLGWLADTTQVSADGSTMQFTTRKGSAHFLEESNGEGQLAYILFDVPGLKYVSRVNFIKNEAWPDNASEKGFHKLGVQYEYKAWTGGPNKGSDSFDQNKMETFVCIREYKNGKPALLAGISCQSYHLPWRGSSQYGGNIPGKAKAQEISEILRKDWDNWKSLFNANNKNLLNDSWEYWIQSGHDYWFAQYRDAITLQNGSIDDYDVHWKEPRKSVFFYIESGLKE